MDLVKKLAPLLCEDTGEILLTYRNQLAEIRLRSNKPVSLKLISGQEILCSEINGDAVRYIACMLMENSIYAREEELKEGFFTSEGGCRIGVCGRLALHEGKITSLSSIGSLCIRVAREIKGCADDLIKIPARNRLVLSPPGYGKTTMIRDFARQLSDAGRNVAVADERREIAACYEGVPQMDVGLRTDVLDGCPKSLAIPMLIRSCSPDVVIADEIGCDEDAQILSDAASCGVEIAATAHASSLDDAMNRRFLRELICEGIFDCIAVLGGTIGHIQEIRNNLCGVDKLC